MKKWKILIENDKGIFEPAVLEGVQWETSRKGEPGKLTFTYINTPEIALSEGNKVGFYYDDKKIFHGYVFERAWSKNQQIQVTCYDQLRYLKNKSSCCYHDVTVVDVLTRICEDFKLKWEGFSTASALSPSVSDLYFNGFAIERFEQMNQTLFDMILTSIDETVVATGELYYIYDDAGTIRLRNIKDTLLDFTINAGTAEDFNYSTSIDKNTYNGIVFVASDDKEETKDETLPISDAETQAKWGVLQTIVELKSVGKENASKMNAIFKHYNKISSSLSITKQLGDVRIRGGCGIYLNLDVGEKEVDKTKNISKKVFKQRMLVEKVTHTFDNDFHYMDLNLIGAETFYDN